MRKVALAYCLLAIFPATAGAKKMTREELPSEAVHFAGGKYKIGAFA
jgi:hypothetical protein